MPKRDKSKDVPVTDKVVEKTPRELRVEERERLKRQRQEKIDKTRLQYKAIEKDAAFVDLREKLSSFSGYHTTLAKDAVGFEEKLDADGRAVQVQVRLTTDQRLSHLDMAAGIDEIINFIDRQVA